MKYINLAVIFALFLFYTFSLNFKLIGSKPLCMRFEGGNKYTLEYVVSGA